MASIQNSASFLPSAEKFHYQFNLKAAPPGNCAPRLARRLLLFLPLLAGHLQPLPGLAEHQQLGLPGRGRPHALPEGTGPQQSSESAEAKATSRAVVAVLSFLFSFFIFLQVWLHECQRVFSDRLVLESDAKDDSSIRSQSQATKGRPFQKEDFGRGRGEGAECAECPQELQAMIEKA